MGHPVARIQWTFKKVILQMVPNYLKKHLRVPRCSCYSGGELSFACRSNSREYFCVNDITRLYEGVEWRFSGAGNPSYHTYLTSGMIGLWNHSKAGDFFNVLSALRGHIGWKNIIRLIKIVINLIMQRRQKMSQTSWVNNQ